MSVKFKSERKETRQFSLEKIASAIHCENLISSLRNKGKDPLILRNRIFEAKHTRSVKPLVVSRDNEMYSIQKMYVHDFLKLKETPKCNTEANNIKSRRVVENTPSNNNENYTILPQINSKKILNTNEGEMKNSFSNKSIQKNTEEDDKNFLITSGMFKGNNFIKSTIYKITVNSFLNKLPKNENEILKTEENIKKKDDKLNNKKYHSYKAKKYVTKLGLMTYLFKKYTSPTQNYSEFLENLPLLTDGNIQKKIINEKTDPNLINSNNDNQDISKNIKTENDEQNNNVKDVNNENANSIFLTKINNPKNSESDISKKNYSFASNNSLPKKKAEIIFNELNKNVIENDQKVRVDCLVANEKDISTQKILYDNVDKTIFTMENDPSYKRVKNIDKNIYNIMKSS